MAEQAWARGSGGRGEMGGLSAGKDRRAIPLGSYL